MGRDPRADTMEGLHHVYWAAQEELVECGSVLLTDERLVVHLFISTRYALPPVPPPGSTG